MYLIFCIALGKSDGVHFCMKNIGNNNFKSFYLINDFIVTCNQIPSFFTGFFKMRLGLTGERLCCEYICFLNYLTNEFISRNCRFGFV